MLYIPSAAGATVDHNIPTPTITGRNAAHGKRSVAERSFVGADLHIGCTALVSPTIKQAAAIMKVSVPYVMAAIELADNKAARTAVLAGKITMLDAVKSVASGETLAEHFARTGPAEWLEAARIIGPDIVWDTMVLPTL
jgi:hypothetical protein